jgi:hypothetical protein
MSMAMLEAVSERMRMARSNEQGSRMKVTIARENKY